MTKDGSRRPLLDRLLNGWVITAVLAAAFLAFTVYSLYRLGEVWGNPCEYEKEASTTGSKGVATLWLEGCGATVPFGYIVTLTDTETDEMANRRIVYVSSARPDYMEWLGETLSLKVAVPGKILPPKDGAPLKIVERRD